MAGLEPGPITIRVGMHTGTPGLDPPKYVGMDVHFAARVMGSAHGGQVVVSQATAELVDVELSELGEHRLKDIEQAVPLFQLGDGSFPPLKTISNTNLPRPASSFWAERQSSERSSPGSSKERGSSRSPDPGGTGQDPPRARSCDLARAPSTRQASSGSGSPRSATPRSSPRRSPRRSAPRTTSPRTSPSASCSSCSTTWSR